MYFSYGQFMVFDQSVNMPGCDWTDEHVAQGFARRKSSVCIRALTEFGDAVVTAHATPYVRGDDHVRVIAVPFAVDSGTVVIEGPEESGTGRTVELQIGSYRLVVAQKRLDEDEEAVDLFFEKTPRLESRSEILVRDGDLDPPSPLIETAGIAGEA